MRVAVGAAPFTPTVRVMAGLAATERFAGALRATPLAVAPPFAATFFAGALRTASCFAGALRTTSCVTGDAFGNAAAPLSIFMRTGLAPQISSRW